MTDKIQNEPKRGNFAAVICELNPPHLGHQRLFDWVRQHYDGLVCIMSGSFVQRGEVAILDKWNRAQLALDMGADMVVELPVPWACARAEDFAMGAVRLADAMHSVGTLVFGCETTDTALLMEIAKTLRSEKFHEVLIATREEGETFAKSRERAIERMMGAEAAALLRCPNAILGIEYCKAIFEQESDLVPVAVQRIGADHHELNGTGHIRSAGELRKRIVRGESIREFVPAVVDDTLQECIRKGLAPATLRPLETLLLHSIRNVNVWRLGYLPDDTEGLLSRMRSAAEKAHSLQEFYALAKTKRYTLARLRRLSMCVLVGGWRYRPEAPSYLHVLGIGAKGGEVFSGGLTLPVVVRATDVERISDEERSEFLFDYETRADDIYALASPIAQPTGRIYTEAVKRPRNARHG